MSSWDPDQYQRFAAERKQPFLDLMGLLEVKPGGRVVDLGCGTGELTVELHRHLQATDTLGVDSAAPMLARAPQVEGVRFEVRDILDTSGDFDVVFSNAALQWVPDHPTLWPRLLGLVRPGGQLAVQMPANYDHASHVVAQEVAQESPYREALEGYDRPNHVLSPEAYADLLYHLGCKRQHVRLQIYGHVLGQTLDVLEWVKGTLLVPFRDKLPPELYDRFVDTYRTRLLARGGDRRPFFYGYKRLLMWASLA